MKIIYGDLIRLALEGQFDVIVHGCNCQCNMGAGIARQIKEAFPEAAEVDTATKKKDYYKLGLLSWAEIQRGDLRFFVVNAYTQFSYGEGCQINYDAIRSTMLHVKRIFSGKRIGYPKIGAGLGGGDWEKISAIIDQELKGEDHTLVEYRISDD